MASKSLTLSEGWVRSTSIDLQ